MTKNLPYSVAEHNKAVSSSASNSQGLSGGGQRALLHTLMQGPRIFPFPESQHKMRRGGGGSHMGGLDGPGLEVVCLTPAHIPFT